MMNYEILNLTDSKAIRDFISKKSNVFHTNAIIMFNVALTSWGMFERKQFKSKLLAEFEQKIKKIRNRIAVQIIWSKESYDLASTFICLSRLFKLSACFSQEDYENSKYTDLFSKLSKFSSNVEISNLLKTKKNLKSLIYFNNLISTCSKQTNISFKRRPTDDTKLKVLYNEILLESQKYNVDLMSCFKCLSY